MKKNQSTWSTFLAVVLAMVVMAGLAVTAFAVTDGGAGNESATKVSDPAALEAVLNGTAQRDPSINYDVDGNGIVEWDDLTVLKGEELPDLLPNGNTDMISLPLDPAYTLDDELYALQHLIVRGDSTVAIKYDSANRNELLDWLDPVDFSGGAALIFDMFWPDEVGSLSVTLICGENVDIEHTIAVKSTQAGWSVGIAELAGIPAEDLAQVWSVWFVRTVADETQTVYIDNMQLVEGNVTYEAGANGVTGLFDKYVIAGRPYGTLPTPERPFYIFEGWYADAEYENEVTAETIAAAGDSYTLYAKWTKDETVDTPMEEGGANASLSVVPGKEDTFLYEVETPSKYEDRYLNIDITDVTASVVSMDFVFRSANRATIVGGTIENGKVIDPEVSIGEAVTPALYITDRQDSNGVFGAQYVIVNKQTGEPVATLELDTEYTVYITLKSNYHTSLKLAPMGNVNTEVYTYTTENKEEREVAYVPYVYSLEVSAPVEHHDAPSMSAYMVPSSGNHAMMSLYKKATTGEWLYGYIASNALPKLSYADNQGNGLDENKAYYRRIHVYTGVATTEVRFDFCYHTALSGAETLVNFGLNNGGTVTIQNTDGTAVSGTPVVGQWYTAVITMDGASLGTSFDVYTLGNSVDGSDTNNVEVELCIKNLRVQQAITADDGSVTLNGGLYNANDRDYAYTILANDVQPFAVTVNKAGAKQMRVKFMLENAANFSIDYVDGDAIGYNNPNVIIVDEDGNALKADKVVAGKWYTAVIYAEIERYESNGMYFWSSGEMCSTGTLTINTAGDLQIKEPEAFDGQFGFRLAGISIEMTKKDMSAYGYKYGYSINVNESSKYDTRMEFLYQRGLYSELTYDFCITEFNGVSTVGADAELWFEGMNITVYDQDGNALASHKDMVVGTWYTVKCDISSLATSEYGISIYSFGEDTATRKPYKANIANINWTPAQMMFDHDYSVKTATLKMNGEDGAFQVDRITKYDGRATYEVVADSDLWSDRALNLSLLDSNKDFIQIDFCYSVSRNAEGKHVAPSLEVYTNLSGTPAAAQYVIVDENDIPVTALETGKWYRLFISTNGSSEFAIVPRTDGWLRVQFKELETFSADEMNVAITSDDPMNVSTANVLDRFGNMQYGIANYAGDTAVVTIRPNATTYKQVRFNFILKELGTPVMSVSGAKIAILDTNGDPVNVADLVVGKQYVAKITNSGDALPTAIKLTVGSGNTRMIIQDLAAYDTTDNPVAEKASSIFHGLADGEMLIAGFLGPRESYVNVHGVAKAPMIRDDIFALLAASGINYIDDNALSYSGSQLEAAQDVLRLASKYGLNYFIGATDIANIGAVTSTYENAAGNTVNNYSSYVAPYETFAAKLDELTQYKSFGGLHLRDEPSADLFDEIGTALSHIEAYNVANGTTLEGFVNLLPGVGSHRWTNGQTISGIDYNINTWSDYVSAYADIANPNFISFDMYPIQGDAGQIEYAYFNFLGYFSAVAKEKGLPMAVCIQVGGGEPSLPNKRQATTNEMHWNVNTSLAFGAEAMTYFIMVEPPYYGDDVTSETKNTHTAINVDGQPTDYYYAIQDINTNVKAIDHIIVNGTHKGVIFHGDMPNTISGTTVTQAPYDGAQLNKSDAKLSAISGNALIGVFEYEGKTALYVVNNSITSANTIGLTFNSNYTYEIITDAAKSWQTGSNVSLNLGIGRAAMIIVHTEAVSTDVLVSFELNCETTAPNPSGKFLTTGQAYGELPTPVRPFYTFGGWYTDAECTGTKVEATTVMNEMNDHALFAKWIPADLAIIENNANHASITEGDAAGSYIYTSNVTGASTDSRALLLNVNVAGKEIVKFDFMFETSLASDGSALTPDMQVADVNNGYWRGANWVATDENGDPVANFVTGKWYTLWITTEGQSSFRIYPMGQNVTQQVNVKMHLKGLEAMDAELPTNYVGSNPGDGATFNHVGFYQSASGDWEIFYSAYNRYSEWLYSGVGANSAYNRRIRLCLDSADYTTATFTFKYNVARHKAAATEEAPNPEWTNILGMVGQTRIVDLNGNAVTTMEEDTWYVAIFSGANGAALAQTIEFYPGGYADGTNGAYAEIEMQIKDVNAYKSVAHPVYTNADGSVSIKSNGIQSILTQDGNNIRYQLNAAEIPYISGSNAIKVTLNDTTKQVISMKLTVNTLTDVNGAASTPWLRVDTANRYDANYVVIDENGNACKTIEAGKTYTLFLTSPENAKNLYSQPSTTTEFVVYPVGKESQSVADITISEIASHAVSGVSVEGGSLTYQTKMHHANAGYYLYDGKWNLSYASYYELYRGSPQPSDNSAENREFFLTVNGTNVEAMQFKLRFVEGSASGTENYNILFSGYTTTFYKNGVEVAAANRKAGEWYDVVVKKDGYVSGTVTVYGLNYTNSYPVNFQYQIADVEYLLGDTSLVKVGTAAGGSITRSMVDGKNLYTYTTRGSTVANGDMSRSIGISFPAGQTHVAVQFRFTEAFEADGVTPIDPYIGVYYAGQGNGGTIFDSFRVYDASGKLAATNNNKQGLIVGEWYTMVVALKSTQNLNLYPIHHRSGDAPIVTMEIGDRFAYVAPESLATFSTPFGNFPEPVVTYYDGQWIQVISGNSATGASQENKQLAVTMANSGTGKLRFEMMMTNASGTAIPHMYGASGLKIYKSDGTPLASSNTALDDGVWYIFEYETGANLGTDRIDLGYLGGGGGKTGGLDVYIRNIQITEIGNFSVNFSTNYDGGETIPSATVEQGAAYGTLPTPAERENYTFAGWYKDAACTGEAVTEATTVSASHTLYAKWEITPDTNPVVVQNNAEYNSGNAKMTCDVVDGKYVYTYTTRGVSAPTSSAYGRRVNIKLTPGAQTHVAIEFRYAEAYHADATTEFAPSMKVISHNEGNGGSWISTVDIYDANGKRITGNDGTTGLTVGQWYTLIVGVYSNTDVLELWTASNYTTDAAILTMEIRDRSIGTYDYTWSVDAGQKASGIGLATVDGEQVWRYTNYGYTMTIDPWGRRMSLTIANETGDIISMKVKITSVVGQDGNPATTRSIVVHPTTSTTLTSVFADEDGNVVPNADLELNKWYTMSFVSDGTASYELWTFASYAQGEILIKDISVDKVETPLTGAVSNGYYTKPAPYATGDGFAYKTVVSNRGDGTNAIDRRAHLTISNTSGDVISMKVNITEANVTPVIVIANSSSTVLTYVTTDTEGNVIDGALTMGEWYTISWISDGSAHYQIRPFDGSAANGTFLIKDIKVEQAVNPFTVPDSKGNATTPSGYYGNATVYDSSVGAIYRCFVKLTGDGTNNWHRRMYMAIANNSGDTITMKVYFASANKGTPGLTVHDGGGTALSATITDAAGNTVAGDALELGQWYTVTWTGNGSAKYEFRPFVGSATDGTFYIKDVTVTPAA